MTVTAAQAAALARGAASRRNRTSAYAWAEARRTVEAGGGLRGTQLARWYARLEALFDPREPKRVPTHIAEFRRLLEERR